MLRELIDAISAAKQKPHQWPKNRAGTVKESTLAATAERRALMHRVSVGEVIYVLPRSGHTATVAMVPAALLDAVLAALTTPSAPGSGTQSEETP